jgi:hypothetical protein
MVERVHAAERQKAHDAYIVSVTRHRNVSHTTAGTSD